MPFLYFLESIRHPVLDFLFSIITLCGEETVFMAVGMIVFWCVDKYRGYYLLCVGFLGTVLNQFLKILCRIPRPWVRDPNFRALEAAIPEAGGYSFPSGHSQTAVGIFGCIAVTRKNKLLRGICIALMILVPFSRMYVGVHTPADVLVGSAMALVMVFAFRPLMLRGNKTGIQATFTGLLFLSIFYLLFVELYPFPADIDAHNYESAVKNAYTFIGCFVGVIIVFIVDEDKLKFDTRAIWWAQILKAVGGLSVVLAVKEGMRPVLEAFLPAMPARAVRYCLIVVVAGLVWPLTFRWFAKLGKNRGEEV